MSKAFVRAARLASLSPSEKETLNELSKHVKAVDLSKHVTELDVDKLPVERSYYVRTKYAVYAEVRYDVSERAVSYLVESPLEEDGHFATLRCQDVRHMLLTLKFVCELYDDIRERLDQAL